MDEYEQNNQQNHTRKPSPAKAVIAMQKPRDASGRFLSGDELAAYQARQQQAQFAAERDHMNSLLGRTSSQSTQQPSPQPTMQGMPQSNFQAILNANKPGSNEDADRWNVLLGKKKNPNQTNNNFRW
jgi:hypothetical protein